jgi:hypothetical protein
LSSCSRYSSGCGGQQQVGPYGPIVHFAGRWGYDPRRQFWQLDVLIDNVQHFSLRITIQGQQGNDYAGLGLDWPQYYLVRVG